MTEHAGDRLRMMGMFADILPPSTKLSAAGTHWLYAIAESETEFDRLVKILTSLEGTENPGMMRTHGEYKMLPFPVKGSEVSIYVMIKVEPNAADTAKAADNAARG